MKIKFILSIIILLGLFACKKTEDINLYDVELFVSGTSKNKIVTFQTNNELLTDELGENNLIYIPNKLRGEQIIRLGAQSKDTGNVTLHIIVESDTVVKSTFKDNYFNYVEFTLK